MPLRFIDIKNNPCLECQARIYLYQALGHVLVDRGLADTELTGGLAHRGAVVNDVVGNVNGAFLYVISHANLKMICFYNVCVDKKDMKV